LPTGGSFRLLFRPRLGGLGLDLLVDLETFDLLVEFLNALLGFDRIGLSSLRPLLQASDFLLQFLDPPLKLLDQLDSVRVFRAELVYRRS
jgi:hypothetical protein